MLEIRELSKAEGGENILNSLSLTIDKKGVFGILCESPETKTVLAEIICGVKNADSGEVLVNGEQMSRGAMKLKKKVRLASRNFVPQPATTVFEYLNFVGDALGIATERRYRQIKEALELTGLDGVKNKAITALDTAKRNMLTLAAAVLGNPELIVADELLDGIHGDALSEMKELLRLLGTMKTVVLLSHNTSDVKELCEEVAIVCGGEVVLGGNIADIEDKINATRELRITIKGDVESALSALRSLDEVIGVSLVSSNENGTHVLSLEHRPDALITDKAFNCLKDVNIPMLSVRAITLSLRDVYYSLTASDRTSGGTEGEERA